MECDTPVKAKKEILSEYETETINIKKGENMSSTLVMQRAPEFEMEAYDAKF